MPYVLALVSDLMFLSRIREAARGAGLEVRTLRRAADLPTAAREGGRLVLLDAEDARLPWSEAVAALRAEPDVAELSVVAFYSHVHNEHAQAAQAAGCDRILARGALMRELPRLLAAAAESTVLREGP